MTDSEEEALIQIVRRRLLLVRTDSEEEALIKFHDHPREPPPHNLSY